MRTSFEKIDVFCHGNCVILIRLHRSVAFHRVMVIGHCLDRLWQLLLQTFVREPGMSKNVESLVNFRCLALCVMVADSPTKHIRYSANVERLITLKSLGQIRISIFGNL